MIVDGMLLLGYRTKEKMVTIDLPKETKIADILDSDMIPYKVVWRNRKGGE